MRQSQFKSIVNKNKNLIYNQAYYFTGSKEDAEDITQDVFIKFWHHMNSIKRASTQAWLLKVAKNLCIDHCRKKKELPVNEIEDGHSYFDEFEKNPEQDLIERDVMEKLLHFINQLPEKMRSILIMRDIQDLKYELIAQTMDLPLNSVKVYLHRGRKMLSKQIKQNMPELGAR